MGSLNKVLLIGHLGADPEVRYTQSNTAVATMNLATNERFKDSNGDWQERTEWHRVIAWGRLAEVCQQFIKKGSQIYIEGSLQTRQWQDKDGQNRYTTEIKAAAIQMLDTKQGAGNDAPARGNYNAPQNNNYSNQQQASKPLADTQIPSEFDSITDDDLPF
ncbi:single-stranded DNA-binding protein [bacterium]|nr:MAG: single-stranded DNA-binding protein [bacterium]